MSYTHWQVLSMTHVVRAPLMHVMFWMQKEQAEAKKHRRDHSVFDDAPYKSILQAMVYGKIDLVRGELDELFSDAAYADQQKWGLVWKHLPHDAPAEQQTAVREQCVLYLLEIITDFDMRILQPMQFIDYQMCWVVFSHPDVACPHRMRIAREVLRQRDVRDPSTQPGTIAWKAARLFESELYKLLQTGMNGIVLYRVFRAIARLLTGGTQEIEGINCIIKHHVNRYPTYRCRS